MIRLVGLYETNISLISPRLGKKDRDYQYHQELTKEDVRIMKVSKYCQTTSHK